MYIEKQEAEQFLKEFNDKVSDEYLEKFEFLVQLLKDDDWSLVIKSHSLVESLITELIISKIDEQKLKSIVERMPLHGEAVSKIQITKIYDLLTPSERKFIRKVSELRNNLVHKYENINFSFDTYTSQFDKTARKNWENTLIWDNMSEGIMEKLKKIIFIDPKTAFWLSTSQFINLMLLRINTMKGEKKIDSLFDKNQNTNSKKHA